MRNDLEWDFLNENLNKSDANIEILSIIIQRHCQKSLYLSLCYIPPASNIDHAIEIIDLLGNEINKNRSLWILGGDMNVNDDPAVVSRKSWLLQNCPQRIVSSQLIKSSTRDTANSSTIIDHIYTSDRDIVSTSGSITYGVSDHNIVFVNSKKNLPKKENVSFQARNSKGYSRNMLEYVLNSLDWMKFYQCEDPNMQWTIMYNYYKSSFDYIVVLIILYCINNRALRSPWMSSELINMIRSRDKFKHQADRKLNNINYDDYKSKKMK